MKLKRAIRQHNLGLALITAGLVIWTLPFIAVAIDNLSGSTRLGDFLINHLGLTFITISPLLVLVGLILLVEQYAKHRRHSGRHRR